MPYGFKEYSFRDSVTGDKFIQSGRYVNDLNHDKRNRKISDSEISRDGKASRDLLLEMCPGTPVSTFD